MLQVNERRIGEWVTMILRRAKRGSIRVGSCVRFDSAAIAKWLMQQGVQRMSKG
jgi:hypothetical protein